jgi:predicted dehydrogenase
MTARLRVGLIGAGAMGGLHARVLAQSTRADLVFVCDPDASGKELAERYDVDWLPSFGTTDVDALVIASPTETHRDLALEAIEAGVPLLVEKPLADTFESSVAIVEASAAADIPIMCGFVERFNPTIMTAMEFVEQPLHITAVRHSPYVARIRTGVTSDLLIHDVDIVLRLIGGQPRSVDGRLGYFHPESQRGSEDLAEALLQFTNGSVAACSASRVSQRKIRSMAITDLDRLVEIDLLRQDITIYRHVANAPATDDGLGYRQQTIIDVPLVMYRDEPLVAQLAHFCNLIEGTVDASSERASLLPPHKVIDLVRRAEASRSASESLECVDVRGGDHVELEVLPHEASSGRAH